MKYDTEIVFKYTNLPTNGAAWWAFPELTLNNNTFASSAAVNFEYKTSVALNKANVGIYVGENDGDSWRVFAGRGETSTGYVNQTLMWQNLELDTQKGDGEFSPENINEIRIGVSVAAENGNTTDKVDLYIRNLSSVAGDVTKDEIEALSAAYSNGKLTSLFNNKIPIKSVEATIDNKTYETQINGSSAELEIDLPYGDYSVDYRITDAANKVYKTTKELIVDKHSFVIEPTYRIGRDFVNNTVGRLDIAVLDNPADMTEFASILAGYGTKEILKGVTATENILSETDKFSIYTDVSADTDLLKLYIWNSLRDMSPIEDFELMSAEFTTDKINYKEFKDFTDESRWTKNVNPTDAECNIEKVDDDTASL